MGEMNQSLPLPVGVPPPMGMQPMMNLPVGAGAVHQPHKQFHHLAYCVHSNPSWGCRTCIPPLPGDVGFYRHARINYCSCNGWWTRDKARVIQSFLFMSGINTLLQTLTGTRLPIIMNASFAFVVPVLSIARDFDPNDFASNHQICSHNASNSRGSNCCFYPQHDSWIQHSVGGICQEIQSCNKACCFCSWSWTISNWLSAGIFL